MDSPQAIKTRSRAVRNIGQITKAMEAVSATKMRKAQKLALSSRPYAFKALDLLSRLALSTPLDTVYTRARPVKTTLVLVVASDRGLAGSFNTSIIRAVDNFFATDEYGSHPDHNYTLVLVGKKIFKVAEKKMKREAATFSGFGDYAKPQQIEPLADFILKGFINGKWDRAIAISNHFRTALKQDVLTRKLLPVDIQAIRKIVEEIVPEYGRFSEKEQLSTTNHKLQTNPEEYIFEPSPQEVLEELLPHLLKMQIYHLILEANASEHSARRVAMKNASDNADELYSNLNLIYNKARQAAITKEIVEIISTQNALEA